MTVRQVEFFQPRGPRHLSTLSAGIAALVRRADASPTDVAATATPADVSRSGIRLAVAASFVKGDRVLLSLYDPAGEPALLERACRVEWCRAGRAGFDLGLSFEAPLDWETLGELFLREVLRVDAAR